MAGAGTGGEAAPGGVSIVWVGVYGYLFLCLNVLFFSSLLAADPLMLKALSREDGWVESLTAVWFLLASLVLFITALVERSFFRRCVYILGVMAMVFAAGEEISWGQRIFGFATPDFLMDLNDQEEFNVHNITNGLLDIIYLNGTLVLCMAAGAAFFFRKDRLVGIPLPSILLTLGFLLILSYPSGANLTEFSGENFAEYLMSIRSSVGGFFGVHERGAVLLLFLIFALFSGQVKLVVACAATLALVSALTYVNYHVNISIGIEHRIRGSLFEVREYLFALGCLFYCLEILLTQSRLVQSQATPRSFRADGSPFLMRSCYLVIAGSIGLIFLGYFTTIARTAALDFGGRCSMEHPLPDYPIARIRTGQFTPEGDRIWVAEFPVGAAEGGQGR